MSLPFTILYRIRIPLRKKAALLTIFSLALITVGFALARVVIITDNFKAGDRQFDASLVHLWGGIEQNVGRQPLNAPFVSVVRKLPHMR